MSLDHPRGGVRKRISPQSFSPSIDSLVCATEGLALSNKSQNDDQAAPVSAPAQPRISRAASSPHTILRQHSRSLVAPDSQSQPASQPSAGSSPACSPGTPSASAQRRLHALRRRITPTSGSGSSTTARTRSASHVPHRRSERRGRFHVVYHRAVSPETSYQGGPTAADAGSGPFTRHSAPHAGAGETVRGGQAARIGIGLKRGLGPFRAASEPPREPDSRRARSQTPNMYVQFGEIEDMDAVAAPQPASRADDPPTSQRRWAGLDRGQLSGAGVGLEPGYLGDQDSRRRFGRRTLDEDSASSMEIRFDAADDSSRPPRGEASRPRMSRDHIRLEGIRGPVGKGYSPSDGSDPLKQMQTARGQPKVTFTTIFRAESAAIASELDSQDQCTTKLSHIGQEFCGCGDVPKDSGLVPRPTA